MTAGNPGEPRPRHRGPWWGLVAIVFGLQLGLIFWLGTRTATHPRRAGPTPTLQLVGKATLEMLTLSDPTLFALPHQQGFSGIAWLKTTQPEFLSFDWSAPPDWLVLPSLQLGAVFDRFIQTNDFNSSLTPPQPGPELTVPEAAPLALSRQHSELRLLGDLARRRLVALPKLPAFRHTDILTNTVVQMAVDPQGKPVSFTLLPPGSGSKEADLLALNLARAAQFEPLGGSVPDGRMPQLSWGQMSFEWQTIPLLPTNAPATGP